MKNEAETLSHVSDYLAKHNVLALATCCDDLPWVAPVFYVHRGADLYFLSAAHTRHCRNLADNPRVAGSVQEDYSSWQDIRGVQLHGLAIEVSAAERTAVVELYEIKFSISGPQAPPEIAAALDKISWYRLQVEQMFFVDNTVKFAHRVEVDVAQLK